MPWAYCFITQLIKLILSKQMTVMEAGANSEYSLHHKVFVGKASICEKYWQGKNGEGRGGEMPGIALLVCKGAPQRVL